MSSKKKRQLIKSNVKTGKRIDARVEPPTVVETVPVVDVLEPVQHEPASIPEAPSEPAPVMLPEAPSEPPTPEPPSYLQGPVFIDGFMHFSTTDLLRYELAEHKHAVAKQAIELAKARQKDDLFEAERAYMAAKQRQSGYQLDISDKSALAKRLHLELIALQEDVAKRYAIPFPDKNLSYDDTTGKIVLLGEPVTSQSTSEPKE